MTALLWNRAGAGAPVLLLAHGAGAPMDSEFMNLLAARLVAEGISVARFEFPYMQRRRAEGGRRPPDRQPVLLAHFAAMLDQMEGPVFVGGKSMGGRMASLLARERDVAGVIAFGYPFVPPGSDKPPRIDHFRDIRAPLLICQGERDAFGDRQRVTALPLGKKARVVWIPDGNHDLKPRKVSGHDLQGNIALAAELAAVFIRQGR